MNKLVDVNNIPPNAAGSVKQKIIEQNKTLIKRLKEVYSFSAYATPERGFQVILEEKHIEGAGQKLHVIPDELAERKYSLYLLCTEDRAKPNIIYCHGLDYEEKNVRPVCASIIDKDKREIIFKKSFVQIEIANSSHSGKSGAIISAIRNSTFSDQAMIMLTENRIGHYKHSPQHFTIESKTIWLGTAGDIDTIED